MTQINMKKGPGVTEKIIPSVATVKIYLALTGAAEPISLEEMLGPCQLPALSLSPRLTGLFKAGLVNRRRTLNGRFKYWWEPKSHAKDLAKEIAAAAADFKQGYASPAKRGLTPGPSGGNDALIAELERRAAILLAAADVLKSAGR